MTEPPGSPPPPPFGSPSGEGPPVDPTAAPELPAWQYPPAQRHPAPPPPYPSAAPQPPTPDQMSSDVCYDAALGYAPTAMAADELEVEFFKPTRNTWAANDKTVICLVLSEERFTSVPG